MWPRVYRAEMVVKPIVPGFSGPPAEAPRTSSLSDLRCAGALWRALGRLQGRVSRGASRCRGAQGRGIRLSPDGACHAVSFSEAAINQWRLSRNRMEIMR